MYLSKSLPDSLDVAVWGEEGDYQTSAPLNHIEALTPESLFHHELQRMLEVGGTHGGVAVNDL